MQMAIKKTAYPGVVLITGLLTPLLAGPTYKAYRIPTPTSQPRDIVLGSDGNLWMLV